MSTYEPGTVAVATVRGVPNVRVMWDGIDWMSAKVSTASGNHYEHNAILVTDVRPLVTLDLDGRFSFFAEFLRFVAANADEFHGGLAAEIADQIEAQTKPPKPEVYAHLPYRSRAEEIVTAVCGKVWRPSKEVTVVGRCPECVALAESEWIA